MFLLAGVSQETDNEPKLFNLFVNDIFKVMHNSKFLLFADDLKIYRSIRTIVDEAHLLRKDLDSVHN